MYKNKNVTNKKVRTIDSVRITTEETEISSLFNSLSVEAGTNGYKGGNAEKGSRTFIKIKNINNTNISVSRDTNGDGVAIKVSGDCELDTLIDAIDFISTTLKKHRKDSGKVNGKNKENKEKIIEDSITAKQLSYLKMLLDNKGFALRTTNIPKADAIELINFMKENQENSTVRIPEKYWKYTKKIFKGDEKNAK